MITNAYQIVTDEIINQMMNGQIPWKKPWSSIDAGTCINAKSGKAYSLTNQMILKKGCGYLTSKQAQEYDIDIVEELAEKVIFYAEKETEDDSQKKRKELTLKTYKVYPVESDYSVDEPDKITKDTIENAKRVAEAFINRANIKLVKRKDEKPHYDSEQDTIYLPTSMKFDDINDILILFHEIIHSSGSKSRLRRFKILCSNYDENDLSKEQLIATMGSHALLHELGIDTSKIEESSEIWIQAFAKDNRLFVQAAAAAQKAAKYVLETASANASL